MCSSCWCRLIGVTLSLVSLFIFFFFKQKTAYGLRISDWSSDVCSSDLPFDPAEFDAPPPSDPGADYRTLLDAMRKAGAEGVAQQVAALAQKIEQDARQRAEWTAQAGVGVNALHRAAGELQRVSAGVWW